MQISSAARQVSGWLFSLLTQLAAPPPAWPAAVGSGSSMLHVAFLYHNCEGLKRVHRWRHYVPQAQLSGVGLQLARTMCSAEKGT